MDRFSVDAMLQWSMQNLGSGGTVALIFGLALGAAFGITYGGITTLRKAVGGLFLHLLPYTLKKLGVRGVAAVIALSTSAYYVEQWTGGGLTAPFIGAPDQTKVAAAAQPKGESPTATATSPAAEIDRNLSAFMPQVTLPALTPPAAKSADKSRESDPAPQNAAAAPPNPPQTPWTSDPLLHLWVGSFITVILTTLAHYCRNRLINGSQTAVATQCPVPAPQPVAGTEQTVSATLQSEVKPEPAVPAEPPPPREPLTSFWSRVSLSRTAVLVPLGLLAAGIYATSELSGRTFHIGNLFQGQLGNVLLLLTLNAAWFLTWFVASPIRFWGSLRLNRMANILGHVVAPATFIGVMAYTSYAYPPESALGSLLYWVGGVTVPSVIFLASLYSRYQSQDALVPATLRDGMRPCGFWHEEVDAKKLYLTLHGLGWDASKLKDTPREQYAASA